MAEIEVNLVTDEVFIINTETGEKTLINNKIIRNDNQIVIKEINDISNESVNNNS